MKKNWVIWDKVSRYSLYTRQKSSPPFSKANPSQIKSQQNTYRRSQYFGSALILQSCTIKRWQVHNARCWNEDCKKGISWFIWWMDVLIKRRVMDDVTQFVLIIVIGFFVSFDPWIEYCNMNFHCLHVLYVCFVF